MKQKSKPQNHKPAAANLPGRDKPWRRVKFQSGNQFVRQLQKLYGDLPLEQLVARWKQDDGKKKVA